MRNSHTMNKDSVLKELDTNIDKGLSPQEAQRRLMTYGLNQLGEDEKVPLWKRFLLQFADPMVLILIAAAVLSAFMALREGGLEGWIDVLVIMAIVMVNAILGVYQEGKADQALAALKKMSSPQTKVILDGEISLIPSEQLVPGDVVILEAGDMIAADLRLYSQQTLKVDESSLTGESVPVEKNPDVLLADDTGIGDRENMLYMGTAVTYGRGKGVVTLTGANSELGQIATRLKSIDNEQTPLQKNLNGLGKVLGLVCLAVCLVVFVVDVFFQNTPWEESLMIAISLAVAAIPEGLAAVVTIVLAIGMTRMAARNAIVRKLLAVETLGCVDVICSDKTGTLTQNEMTVKSIFNGQDMFDVSGIGYAPEGVISLSKTTSDDQSKVTYNKDHPEISRLVLSSVLCNDATIKKTEDNRYTCIGDPTEGSLVAMAAKAGYDKEHVNVQYTRVTELPFDSERKMMTTYHSNIEKDSIISFTKGAPDIILDRCTHYFDGNHAIEMKDEVRSAIEEVNHGLATQALRVLAFAYRVHDLSVVADFSHENDLVFMGLVGMIDPARTEVKDAIRVCKDAGIRPVMITGDYKDTAVAIAKDLGMIEGDSESLSGADLDRMTDEDLQIACEKIRVYARVSPDHKVRIVNALKHNQHIASMTGDGVNDAMALKSADIGVAMGITGTEVAKNSADMILTDDNFATIVDAVEEGRIIYSNIKKFVGFLLSCNVAEILIIFFISLIPVSFFNKTGTPLLSVAPLTAIQLLWLNLVTDSFPALALGREKGEPGIMKQLPRKKSEAIINNKMKITILVQSIAIFIAVAISFFIALNVLFVDSPDRLALSRTMAFATLIMAELFRAFSARSELVSIFKLGLFSNRSMNVAVAFSAIMMILVIYVPGMNTVFKNLPLPLIAWLPIIGLAIIPFAAGEIFKIFKTGKS
ncbi:MAG: cation-translocating P-type ATPase [Clostridiaceae bacterium]|nr:cation-translocating P-type ATPase [Clostridiaceae bacterium]